MSTGASIRSIAFGLALAALAADPAPSQAGFPPARYFAGFAAVKPRLGTVPLLADVTEIERMGNPDKVYVDDCRTWADRAMETLAERLAKAGYRVGERAVPTIGVPADPEHECWTLSRFQDDHRRAFRDEPLAPPPFHVHEGFAATPDALAEWNAMAAGVWTARLEWEGADRTVPAAGHLADLVGSDVAFVLLGYGSRVPVGRKVKEDLLDAAREEMHARDFRRLVFAVVDLRRGELLWWDENRAENQSLGSWSGFGGVARRFVGHLP